MRLTRFRRRPSLGINMTPMIDIVFLLIIFFMTVSQISRAIDYPVKLPDVGEGGTAMDTVSITINLDAQGRLIVIGKELDMDRLVQALKQELSRVDNRHERLKILVRCDRDCPGKFVNQMIGQLELLGIRQVRISVNTGR